MVFGSIIYKHRRVLANLPCLLNSLELPKIVNCPNIEAIRGYSEKKDKGCRRALVDIPDPPPPCDLTCDPRKKKKKGILQRIKLRIVEGGTNFGTPFRRLIPKKQICEEPEEEEEEEPKALPPPQEILPEEPEIRPGVQVSILGAESCVGQYTALLLKQCPCIKRLRLYQASEAALPCGRDLYQVVQDLQCIPTNCSVQAYSCHSCELNLCLQSSDIVLMLDCAYTDAQMSFEQRFLYHAPMVKQFADAIAQECPKAFIIVNTSPIDCMVPLIAEDKLLNKLEENEPELASSPEEECVICVNAKATMQTSPCGHRVVCRRCFVKTIQMAVSQRMLPLRCVICRAKILRLRQAPRLVTSKSWQVSSSSGKTWGVPGSVSSYSVGARSVPASASLYSVTSGESSLSGVSSVSSNSGGNVSNVSNTCSTKLCGGDKCGGACLGAVPRATASAPARPRQPASNSLRRSQHHSMKARLQEYQVHSYTGGPATGEPSGRLPPIREFQREFREGRRESAAAASASTRIRCAQKIVTQLETSPQKKSQHFFRPLKPSNKDDSPKSRDHSKETERQKENPKAKPKKEEKKKKDEENTKQEEKSKKEEICDNKKNEIAERKKEEKLRLKAEKEAKKEAKLLAKEEERQAKLLAKEEERQAKLLAKEEKKKAKKEAKLAAQAEKEREKSK